MRSRKRKKLQKVFALGITLTACIAGAAYMFVQTIGLKVADEYGCFDEVSQTNNVIIIDVSEPRFDKTQVRSIFNHIKRTYEGLSLNEKMSVFTTAGGKVSSVVSPDFIVCGKAKNSIELEEIGAAPAQSGYLKKQRQSLFDRIVKPELDKILSLNPDDSFKQLYESPIFEMIKSVVRDVKLESGDTLHIIGDMVQNSNSVRQCRVQNDLPRYSEFKKRQVYIKKLKPRSVDGVEVNVLMIIRNSYGEGSLKYCTEIELIDFWKSFFKDHFKSEAEFIRIRQGFGS